VQAGVSPAAPIRPDEKTPLPAPAYCVCAQACEFPEKRYPREFRSARETRNGFAISPESDVSRRTWTAGCNHPPYFHGVFRHGQGPTRSWHSASTARRITTTWSRACPRSARPRIQRALAGWAARARWSFLHERFAVDRSAYRVGRVEKSPGVSCCRLPTMCSTALRLSARHSNTLLPCGPRHDQRRLEGRLRTQVTVAAPYRSSLREVKT